MKATIKYNRRSFIKSSAAAGGGLVLGFNWLASACSTPANAAPVEWFDVNAFLKIANDGTVTIMSPNPEIGQGVKTAMPMIVAEELDVAWKDVVVEQAGLDTEKYTRQLAGGSQSIRQGWESLRMAGATARKLLVETAAKKWEVPASELTTEAGMVKHSNGKSIGYGELAADAATMEVPEEVELKDPKDFKIIGQDIKNVDATKIAKGEPLFGIDIQREGMLIAMIVHPPVFGMKLKSFDASKAEAMPGVKQVFSFSVDQKEGVEKQWPESNINFHDLVAVVGTSTWEVKKAKEALAIEWETTSKPEDTAFHDQVLGDLVTKNAEEPARKDGNPDRAFRTAAKVIERTYDGPFLAHNTMEPMNFFAHVTDEKVELEGPIQTPEPTRTSVSNLLGVPEDKISIMLTRMGGGFGRRLYNHFVLEAAQISKIAKAPIKLVYTREDDMTQGTYRPSYKITYKAGLDKDNNLVAFSLTGAGTNDNLIFANRFPAGTVDNYMAQSHRYESNISTGAWRAPRSNFIAYAEQAFIDEVAETAGKDPIDMRLELFDRAINNPVGEKNDYDPARYAGVLKLVKEKSNWEQPKDGIHKGVSAYFCHNSYVAQVVEVRMVNDRPKIEKVYCAVDCGIVVNRLGALNQIEGGIIDGIGHAMFSALSFKDGQVEQNNFDKYRLIRLNEAPEIETHFVDNGVAPTGLGEPTLPPIAAAVANAIYKATGTRLYKQPFTTEGALLG